LPSRADLDSLAAMPPTRPARSPFVGRASELTDLEGALGALASGGSLFLVHGEPGIGKTRLADEIARRATSAGVRVLWGRCREVEGRPPYWPWIQVIQSHAREADPAKVASELDAAARPLGLLVPELRPHLDAAGEAALRPESEAPRFLLFEAMASFLRRIAEAQPVLLILDDLHWADLPSLLLLDFLAHELAAMPLVVLGTYREIEVRRDPAALQVIDSLGRKGRQLALAGFTLDEAVRFIESATEEVVPAAVAMRLHRETEGNPFFLDEIVRLFRGGGEWFASAKAGFPISQGVRGAIRQRLAPLGSETRRVLRAAAVAGREFDLTLLEGGTDTARGTLLDVLGPALEIEVITGVAGRPGRYRFSHALVRDTIYEELPPVARAELHRRFGELLEERHQGSLDDSLAEVAHHFFQASAEGGEEKAIDYAERAGREALRSLAYEEAALQFERALHLTELAATADPARSCELLLSLGEAKNRAGMGEESAQAFRRAAALARRARSSALLARAATGLSSIGSAWAEYGRSDDALVRVLQEALADLGEGEGMLRARVMARLATELCWSAPPARTHELSSEAVRLARRASDPATLAYTLLARIHCLSDPDHVVERLALVDEVIALSEGRGDLAANAYLWRLGDALQLGRMAEVDACRESVIRVVTELRQPGDRWMIPAVQSQRALLEGRFAEAESFAGPMLTQPTRKANAEQASSALIYLVQREQGRHGALAAGIKSLSYQYPTVVVWRAALAMLYAEIGDLRDARIELDALYADGLAALRFDLTWLFSLACLAEAIRACGAPHEAEVVYAKLLPYQDRNVVAGPLYYMGPVSYYLGLLAASGGRPDAAAAHLEAALGAARSVGAAPYVARILLALADAAPAGRLAGGRSAAELRREGGELARSLGMQCPLADAAPPSEEASAYTATPRGASTAHLAVLARDGDDWVISYRGRTQRLAPARGLAYLARLLAEPHREFHVLDLVAVADDYSGPTRRRLGGADLGPMLDARAKAEMRHRLEDLRAAEEEAEQNNDAERAGQAREEIERLGYELGRAVGLGGRDRRAGAVTERARASVTKAIRAAIRRIAAKDAGLAALLSRMIRTGTFCSYDPIEDVAIVRRPDAEPPR
jgi:hypothetical protein